MAKQSKNLIEQTREITGDNEFANELAKRIEARKIIKYLVAMRSAKGLSQSDIATAMECTQSRISKLESGLDDDLRVGDLDGYLDALGLHGRLVITKKQSTTADAIKYHWHCLGQLLDRLLDLAGNDAEIARGIGKFSNEIAYNYMSRITDFIKQLPDDARTLAPNLGIEVEEMCIDDDSVRDDVSQDCKSHQPRISGPCVLSSLESGPRLVTLVAL